MKITATPIKAHELKAGDLFSTHDQGYWNHYDKRSIGQSVYIRTDAPPLDDQEKDLTVYRITIERDLPEPSKEVVSPRGGFRFNRY